ncbi:carbonic anhydrase family protein [Yersinia nurmii]|uniref:Carbonic anhydrase n=1 Tax=Yersinia nurmii TaxID=685706 RepID=A0AAW7JWY4_9GAMM|nr:carbonic anhydrase family protein [Yersinia nurmii]MDN0086186.1 carbonic anhydrase family protein [Yersinia nurmii]
MKGKLLLAILLSASFSLQADETSTWTYEGQRAPEHWGTLKPEFHLCQDGRNQSPIDIRGELRSNLAPLTMQYFTTALSIVNNGHTVQLNVPSGNKVQLDGETFMLKQLHFHSPSENTIKGKQYPMEAHFLHKNKQGELLVVAVMYELGKENVVLEKVWQQIPKGLNQEEKIKQALDLNGLIPDSKYYYRFSGSLTTPPCSEGVRWLVFKQPLSVSENQITQFKSVIHHDNNRPVQELHGRVIVN